MGPHGVATSVVAYVALRAHLVGMMYQSLCLAHIVVCVELLSPNTLHLYICYGVRICWLVMLVGLEPWRHILHG